MQRVIAIILVIGLLFQQSTRLALVLNYTLNKEYIAKNLCEKKDIPQSTCKGKCHLKKQLEEEDKKEKKSANPFQEKFETFNISEYENWMHNTQILQLSVVIDVNTNNYSFSFIREIHHPPSLV